MEKNNLISGIFLAIILLTIYHIFSLEGLYADGAYFLLRIMESGSFFDFYDARRFAHLVTQVPVVTGLKLGVTDIDHLSLLHSLGLFLFPSLFWLMALNRLKREMYFWPFFLVYVLVVMNSNYFSIGEYNLAYSAAGYSFAVLISKRKINIIDGIFLVFASWVLVLSYESLSFLGVLLFITGAYRAHYHKKGNEIESVWIYIPMFFHSCAAAIAFWSILHPRSPEGLNEAANSLFLFTGNKQLIISTIVSMLYFYAVFFHVNRHYRLTTVTLAVSLILTLFFPSLWSQPSQYYEARIVVGLLMFSLLLFIFLVNNSSLMNGYIANSNKKAVKREIWIIPCLLFFATSIVDVAHTYQHTKFIHELKSIVNSNKGFHSIDSLKLNHQEYGWPWTYPTLSLILRTDQDKAIILNSQNYNGWQPFDPEKTTPDLSRYYLN